MQGRDYLREIHRFTTSHYWNSGVRVTVGVVLPMLIMISNDWLTEGISFLFGALFVSLTDTIGPIHHRRNGMFVAIVLNTFTVLVTSLLRDHQIIQLFQIIVFSFFFSMLGVYGARAGAIGTLALVMMLIHMSPFRTTDNIWTSVILTTGGGLWYAVLSLSLNRLQPYRVVEQAQGEHLMLIGRYIRARGEFYRKGIEVDEVFNRVMKEQVEVLKIQGQLRELLFKTRQLAGDASPKSRSLMMIFLESLDLFEETMYSYLDYSKLREQVDANLLDQLNQIISKVAAEFERIGLAIQASEAVKRMPDLDKPLKELVIVIEEGLRNATSDQEMQNLLAIKRTSNNLLGQLGRLRKIIAYTRMEAYDPNRFPDQEIEKPARSPRITFLILKENITLRSNTFRFAVRIMIALLAGYAISFALGLSHAYWVMLTTLTILKPLYHLTRARNIQRVLGTLGGVVLAIGIVYFISNTSALLAVMIFCMLMAYSLLRINYFWFVLFLTVYVIITFHFLNPLTFTGLIGERLIDTLIGSVIAALAARFIFPVWQHYQIESLMKKSLLANTAYFLATLNLKRNPLHTRQYNGTRNEAIVTLTNLSDSFQQMLAEPGRGERAPMVHQFVIASHLLTSRISSLLESGFTETDDSMQLSNKITDNLQHAISNLESIEIHPEGIQQTSSSYLPALHPLALIYSISRDIRTITSKWKFNNVVRADPVVKNSMS